MPELRDLRTFIAVAERLSFTRAAEALHLRQQTVSRIIRDLESELGVELLERTTREVRMTPAGVALLEEGREALRRADAAFDAARSTGGGHAGTVHVGSTPPVGITDRAEVVEVLRRGRPALSIAFHELRPSAVRESLRSGRVDLALSRVSAADEDSVDCIELRPSPMAVCMAADHPLAGRTTAQLIEFDGERLLSPGDGQSPFTKLLLARFAEAGATLTPIESRVTGGATQLADLSRLGAVAVMPTGTARPDGVISVPVDGFTLPLLLLWPAGRPPAAVRLLRTAMKAAATQP